MSSPLTLPSLELVLDNYVLGTTLCDFLDDDSVRNISLTSHTLSHTCSVKCASQRSLPLLGAIPAIPANNVAPATATASAALAVPNNMSSASFSGGSALSNGLGASTVNHPSVVNAMDQSGSDQTTDTESESEDDKEYRDQLEVDPAVFASLCQNYPQANTTTSLPGLPTELAIMVFKNLDVIDAVCLGLTSRRHYHLYSSLFGLGVKLNTRRLGQAGTVERSWEVVGKELCDHCSSYRCQLYRHINTWMGENLEYCLLKENFGACAKEGARETCYRNKPSKPRRCGRHPVRTTTMHQDDNFSSNIRPYPF